MNKVSIIGLIMGIGAILGGTILEGGKIDSIVQGSAALIVFGGTAGATFLSFSFKDLMRASQLVKEVFIIKKNLPDEHFIIETMVSYATKARMMGILALDVEMKRIEYDFFKHAMSLAIDGTEPQVIEDTLEQQNRTFEEERSRAAKVFECAGGYAPTVGIIGAVLGLIHVMENLSDPTKLGSGIAIAFVATVYGVASANILFLPLAKKMSNITRREVFLREMIIDGVLSIQAGKNPFYLKEQLGSYLSK